MNWSLRRAFLAGLGPALLLLAAAPGHARDRRAYDRGNRMKDYDAKIAQFEAIMDRFYRGESIDEMRKRHNALVEEHNRMVAARNRETKVSQERLDRELAPVRKLQAEVEAMDERLKRKPGTSDRMAVRRYNALVDRRNARVEQANEFNRELKPKIDAHNGLIERVKEEVKASSERLAAMRKELDARADAYEKFQKSERDLAFFRAVNECYADLHEERRRRGGNRELDRALAKVRGLRRELGVRAMKGHESREYGLVVIEAALAGNEIANEPCFFIVDTGAMRTTVAPGLVRALGIPLGDETEFTLAGGEKIKGREIVLRVLTVGKVTERDVEAAAVKVSEVGIDGLLGQSFLKRFIYAIDESRKGKLILRRRKK